MVTLDVRTQTQQLAAIDPQDVKHARIALVQAMNGVGAGIAQACFMLERAKSAIETLDGLFAKANSKITWEAVESEQAFTESVYGATEYGRIVQALDQLNAAAFSAIHDVAEPLGCLVKDSKCAPEDGCEQWLRIMGRPVMVGYRECK